jgi:pyruvate/2-oxoglutarate dehydrogenase complex dihydrolipoamide dehydrogenase (E3) component
MSETKTGDRVVIIGGGLLGCETGLYLTQQGKDITIVEMLDDVALKANIMHRRALMLEIEKSIAIKAGFRCTKIIDSGLIATDRDGREMLFDADNIVVAAGLKPRSDVVERLRGAVLEFRAIGDCTKPGNVLTAVRSGYDAAMAIQDL